MKQRQLYLDTLAGFFIILMIFYHICQHTRFVHSILYERLSDMFFFFMPWFFFKAGIFQSKRTLYEEFYHLKTKILFPFVVFSIVGYIVNLLRLGLLSTISIDDIMLTPLIELFFMGSIYGNLPLWFLLSFFFVRLAFEYCIEKKYNLLSLCICSLVMAYFINLASIHVYRHIPYYLGNVLLGFSFMAISRFLQRYKLKASNLLFTIPLWLLNTFYFKSFLDFRSNSLLSGNYFIYFISSVAGIISVNYMVRFVELKKPIVLNIFCLLSYVGKNSLFFYILHWLIILLVELIMGLLKVQDHFLIAILMSLGCMFIIPLYIKLKLDKLHLK